MERHISKLCQSCFFQLRRLRSIRHSFSRHALLTLVHAFISSRLDFCNSALFGVSGYLLDRLQSILNAAARLVLKVSKYDHISGAMRNELHWLPIVQRINYKICLLVRNCLAGTGPVYLSEFATWWAPRLEGVIFVLLLDQFWSSLDTVWNAMVDEASQSWGRICGIYFPWMYETMRSGWTFSKRS